MTMDHAALTARLPKGFVAREFRESDREPLVEAQNRESHPMEHGSAQEWREWERIAPDPTQVKISVEASDGTLAAFANVGIGPLPLPDGAYHGGVGVAIEQRGKGIGGVLLEAIEKVATLRGAPRLLGGGSEARPGVDWAKRRGYREIGRRIESYVDLPGFDPAAHSAAAARTRASSVRLRSIAEILAERGEDGRDGFFHELWEAEAPMWDDVPWATPTPHWPFERFNQLVVESGKLIPEASVVALDGKEIVGLTTTGRSENDRGYTWMTGVARTHRGNGIAQALKVDALARAKALGLRALLTTNDEPNKAMRGINAKLGYQMLPARVQLEKTLRSKAPAAP